MVQKKILPMILLAFNLVILAVLGVWVKGNVETHVSDSAKLRTTWRYAEEISYQSLEQDRGVAFCPQSRYLGYVEGIFINLPDVPGEGILTVEIYDGADKSGKRIATTEVPFTDIVAGEWQKIPLEVWLSPSKTYWMNFHVAGADTIPYLIYTNQEFTIAEHEAGAPAGEDGQPVIAYYYGEKINAVAVLTVLLLLACIDVGFICRLTGKGQKKYLVWALGGSSVPELTCWVSLLILFIFLHVYRLAHVPLGVNIDEMGMGYDAWALSHFGVDRWGMSFPVYLQNHMMGQSVLYCLLCMPFIRLWGITEAAMRMPAVLASFVTLFAGGGLVWRRCRDKRWLFLYAALMTITPYFIYSGRFGLDCNLFLMTSTLFLLSFEKARCGRKIRQWIAAGVFGGIMLYSYALSWMVLPLFLAVSLVWLLLTRRIRFMELIAMGIPLFLLSLPLLLFNAVNMLGWDSIRICGITIPKIQTYRSGMLFQTGEGHSVIQKLRIMFRAFFLDSGETYPVVMPLYWISIPFFFVGLWRYYTVFARAVKKKQYTMECTVFLWLAAQCVMGASIDMPVTYRMNGAYFAILLMTAEGVRCAWESSWDGRKAVLTFTAAIYFISFISFTNRYFIRDHELRPLSYYPLDMVNQEVLDEITQREPDEPVYIYTNDNWCSYVYYLAANKITPEGFAEGGASRISWKNVYFDFSHDEIDRNAVYVIMEGLEERVDELHLLGMKVKKLGHYYVVF